MEIVGVIVFFVIDTAIKIGAFWCMHELAHQIRDKRKENKAKKKRFYMPAETIEVEGKKYVVMKVEHDETKGKERTMIFLVPYKEMEKKDVHREG